MLTKTIDRGPIAPANDELSALTALKRVVDDRRALELTLVGSNGDEVQLTESALDVLRQALDELVQDRIVVVTGMARELSIEQAAHLLNAPHIGVADLVDHGVIPSHVKYGRPRIWFDDLMAYKRRLAVEREDALQRLADQSQEIAPLLS